MHKSQARRATIARRAATAGRVSTPNRSAAPLVGAAQVLAIQYIRRSSALPMTGAMRSGDGVGVSAWARPAQLPHSMTAVAGDRRWDQTVQRQEA